MNSLAEEIFQDDSKISFEEYLRRLACARPLMATSLEPIWVEAQQAIANFRAYSGARNESPIIYMVGGNVLAETISVITLLSHTFISACLGLRFPYIEKILPDLYQFQRTYDVALVGLIWSLAHENAHAFRGHTDVDQLSIACDLPLSRILRATEYDADLMAVSAVYRHIQASHPLAYNNKSLRRYLMFCLCWVVFGLDAGFSNEQHPPIQARLYHMMRKLAYMGVGLLGVSRQEEYLGLQESFCEVMMKCDRLALRESPPIISKSVIRDMIEDEQSGAISEVMNDWEKIKDRIALISGTKTKFL